MFIYYFKSTILITILSVILSYHRQSTNTSIPIDIDFDDDTIKITDDFEVISTLSNYHRGREEAIVSLFSIEATAS